VNISDLVMCLFLPWPIRVMIYLTETAFYFLPSMIASNGRHRQRVAIYALNLFLGWSFIGWVIALVWALARSEHKNAQLGPLVKEDCSRFVADTWFGTVIVVFLMGATAAVFTLALHDDFKSLGDTSASSKAFCGCLGLLGLGLLGGLGELIFGQRIAVFDAGMILKRNLLSETISLQFKAINAFGYRRKSSRKHKEEYEFTIRTSFGRLVYFVLDKQLTKTLIEVIDACDRREKLLPDPTVFSDLDDRRDRYQTYFERMKLILGIAALVWMSPFLIALPGLIGCAIWFAASAIIESTVGLSHAHWHLEGSTFGWVWMRIVLPAMILIPYFILGVPMYRRWQRWRSRSRADDRGAYNGPEVNSGNPAHRPRAAERSATAVPAESAPTLPGGDARPVRPPPIGGVVTGHNRKD
jgi:hypothetical protein